VLHLQVARRVACHAQVGAQWKKEEEKIIPTCRIRASDLRIYLQRLQSSAQQTELRSAYDLIEEGIYLYIINKRRDPSTLPPRPHAQRKPASEPSLSVRPSKSKRKSKPNRVMVCSGTCR
jgi:hypothetical protein